MMQSLRDNMKIIIWITAIVFLVGFGILQLGGVMGDAGSQAPRGIVAKINGEEIHLEVYSQMVNQMTGQLTAHRALQEGEDSYIREQAWSQLVSSKLMEQEAHKRGIQVTPDEIKASIRISPPDFLMQAPVFQTDGQFDYKKYLGELDNPDSRLPWGQVETAVANQLPLEKLRDQVILSAKVSDGDVRDRFMLQNEKVDIRYVAFTPDSFPVDTSRIGGADIESYYKAHPEKFTGPAETKVQVTMVPRLPNAADFSAQKERLQGIVEQIQAEPDSFGSFARTYSEIQSAANGGDPLGAPYADEMRPSFVKGLRGVGEGQLSPIIQEERSLHVFRVDKRYPDPQTKRERLKYHEIAIRVQPGPDAIAEARKLVTQCAKEAKTAGLSMVATRHALRTFQSDYFPAGASGNEIFQRFPDIEAWCFSAPEGAVSRPIPTETGWYLYQIVDKRKEGLRPLTSIERDAKVALIRSLRTARAEEAARQALAAIKGGMKEDAAAKQFRAKSGEAKSITRNGYLPGLGRDVRAVGMLFGEPVSAWTPVITSDTFVLVGYIEAHDTPSEDDYQKQAATIRQSLLNERRQVIFTEWMSDIRKKAKIVDYRENYFDA